MHDACMVHFVELMLTLLPPNNDTGLSLHSWPACLSNQQRCGYILPVHHGADGLMPDDDWIHKLDPHEAQIALEHFANYGPMTAREATVIHRWERLLRAKAAPLVEPKE